MRGRLARSASCAPPRQRVAGALFRLEGGYRNARPVASMSHGIAGSYCKPLKQCGNVCDTLRHENGLSHSAKPLNSLATPAGFEPATFSLEGCCVRTGIIVRWCTVSRVGAATRPVCLGKKGWELDLKSNVSQWTLFGGLEVVTHWDYSLATLRPWAPPPKNVIEIIRLFAKRSHRLRKWDPLRAYACCPPQAASDSRRACRPQLASTYPIRKCS
jgi:hypothetical protein